MGWDKYGLCKCGYFERTLVGDPWFWPKVCPGCGEWPGGRFESGGWKLVTGRRRGFFGQRLEVKED